MEAGKLKHYVTLQNKTNIAVGSRGQLIGSGSGEKWQDVYDEPIPAEVVTLAGREAEIARQIVPSADTRIRLRFVAGVTPFSRFVWDSRKFNVVWVNNTNQQNFELVCLCQEVFA